MPTIFYRYTHPLYAGIKLVHFFCTTLIPEPEVGWIGAPIETASVLTILHH